MIAECRLIEWKWTCSRHAQYTRTPRTPTDVDCVQTQYDLCFGPVRWQRYANNNIMRRCAEVLNADRHAVLSPFDAWQEWVRAPFISIGVRDVNNNGMDAAVAAAVTGPSPDVWRKVAQEMPAVGRQKEQEHNVLVASVCSCVLCKASAVNPICQIEIIRFVDCSWSAVATFKIPQFDHVNACRCPSITRNSGSLWKSIAEKFISITESLLILSNNQRIITEERNKIYHWISHTLWS